eukprot:gene1114-1272_t
MIDNFTIITKGGIVLWSIEWARLKGKPIDNLIKKVLVEERGADSSFICENHALKWTFANDVDLIFIVVYQKILSLMYLDELLAIVKRKFIKMYKDMLVAIKNSSDAVVIDTFEPFTDKFDLLLRKVEQQSKVKSAPSVPKRFEDTEKGKQALEQKKEQELKEIKDGKKSKTTKKKETPKKPNGANKKTLQESTSGSSGSSGEEDAPAIEADSDDEKDAIAKNIKAIKRGKKTPTKKTPVEPKSPTPVQKIGRKWDDVTSKKDAIDLDMSEPSGVKRVEEKTKIEKQDMDIEVSSDEEDKPVTGFMKYFQVLTGNRTIGAEDLEPVLSKFKTHLTTKNVALDIAEKIVDSIGSSLEGKKLSTFQGVNQVVKTAMEETMTRILTPKKQVDILRDISAVRGKRPYAIVFSGVNGVGKSTNLAKVAYWLTANGNKVMMAACDTFRSGAIEQLKTHADRLNIEVFERGYGKDAAAIAGEAIDYARDTKHDVVLIDTTGRMQNNEPLMRALSKLVNQNTIDLVLFVGEALVGNDGVDQLVKFDKSLSILADATSKEVRTIDGIILTKFDTIDDKVGAAISMVYSTGHPIIFLGTGQNYQDLKRMNIKSVVKSLLN